MICKSAEFIEISKELLRAGTSVRFEVCGSSMYPFIRSGDTVKVEPVDISMVRPADIVFSYYPDGEAVVHRVIGKKNIDGQEALITKGDFSRSRDDYLSKGGLLGRVVVIEKDYGTLRIDRGVGRYVNILYCATLPLGRWIYLFVSIFLRRAAKKSGNIPEHSNDVCYENTAASPALLSEAAGVVRAFSKHGIPTIVLKGAFLAGHIYKNAALRPMTDVDILIRKDDLPKANDLLAALGYQEPPSYQDFLNNKSVSPINSIMYFSKDPGRVPVHIHWHIINSTWPLERLVRRIDMGRLWAATMPVTIGETETLTLSSEHLLIYIAHHSFHHCFDRPSMVTDITETMRCYKDLIDWNIVREEAKRFGLGMITYAAIKCASKISGYGREEAKRIKPPDIGFLERKILNRLEETSPDYRLVYLTYLLTQASFAGRLGFIFSTVFPARLVISGNLRIPLSRVRPADYLNRVLGGVS